MFREKRRAATLSHRLFTVERKIGMPRADRAMSLAGAAE
jgi:hypothetical protein